MTTIKLLTQLPLQCIYLVFTI